MSTWTRDGLNKATYISTSAIMEAPERLYRFEPGSPMSFTISLIMHRANVRASVSLLGSPLDPIVSNRASNTASNRFLMLHSFASCVANINVFRSNPIADTMVRTRPIAVRNKSGHESGSRETASPTFVFETWSTNSDHAVTPGVKWMNYLGAQLSTV